MKRRKTKKIISRIEHQVAAELRRLLLDAASSNDVSGLNCALVSLINVRLSLDYPAGAKRWWVDDVEWTQVSRSPSDVMGTGKLWCGIRSQPAGEIIETPFVASLRLKRSGQDLSYVLSFEHEGTTFRLCKAD